ncbi:hypothetical protein SAMN05216228_102789 [Rhizobium tibeticum]|uniref:Uncharacterized protein n=1 Tax=Rhizobium tibeticum TaxID=501024 RepID=A0A1H8T7I1_9HYPH|nr:hypothetical protein [Rhizobium tibeticum]SEI14033.1 hypothetical protein RTCCBAU85039_5019 [Rhizobium tibeticum]SEO86861.1 hypothetical protein SAMN05216228_102789 [Rhizobium tibeticum]
MRSAILRSLTLVGPSKPVGYLPINTIKRFLDTTPKALAAAAARRGLASAHFTTRNTGIQSGALYVYDCDALERLLDEQAEAVAAAGLPLNADMFVAHIAAVFYDTGHPAHRIIAAAFGECAP